MKRSGPNSGCRPKWANGRRSRLSVCWRSSTFDGWFRRRTFEGCLFINALIEIDDRSHPVHRECRRQLAHIRDFVAELAAEAGAADPDDFARQWHILMKGSIVAAGEGDADAAIRAKEMGALLVADRLRG